MARVMGAGHGTCDGGGGDMARVMGEGGGHGTCDGGGTWHV